MSRLRLKVKWGLPVQFLGREWGGVCPALTSTQPHPSPTDTFPLASDHPHPSHYWAFPSERPSYQPLSNLLVSSLQSALPSPPPARPVPWPSLRMGPAILSADTSSVV